MARVILDLEAVPDPRQIIEHRQLDGGRDGRLSAWGVADLGAASALAGVYPPHHTDGAVMVQIEEHLVAQNEEHDENQNQASQNREATPEPQTQGIGAVSPERALPRHWATGQLAGRLEPLRPGHDGDGVFHGV